MSWTSTNTNLTTNANITQKWRRGVYGNGYYIISRNAGGYAYSNDLGVSWTFVSMVTGGIVMFGNGVFLVYGSGVGIRKLDTRPSTPVQSNPSVGTSGWIGGAYGNGRWILIQPTMYATSVDDGDTWTITAGSFTGVTSIVYGNGYFVACRSNSSVFSISSNGTTWTTVNVTSSDYVRIIYANSFFVAASPTAITTLSGSNPSIVTHHPITLNFTSFYLDIAGGDGLFVMVGGNTSTSPFATTIGFSVNPFVVHITQQETFAFPLELVIYDPDANRFVSFIDTANRTAVLRLTTPWP